MLQISRSISSSSSLSESIFKKFGVASLTPSSSISAESVKGFSSFSVKIDSWEARISFPFLHGWFFLQQWISSSFEPSVGRFNAHDWNEFFIISGDKESHESRIHVTIVLRASWWRFCVLFVCLNKRPLSTEGGAYSAGALINIFTSRGSAYSAEGAYSVIYGMQLHRTKAIFPSNKIRWLRDNNTKWKMQNRIWKLEETYVWAHKKWRYLCRQW